MSLKPYLAAVAGSRSAKALKAVVMVNRLSLLHPLHMTEGVRSSAS